MKRLLFALVFSATLTVPTFAQDTPATPAAAPQSNHSTQTQAGEARKGPESVRYEPTKATIERAIRKTVKEGGTSVGPVSDSWTIKVRIDSAGEYDKQAKYLRVDAVAILTDGVNEYAVAPEYVRLTTDGQGNWKAEFVGSKL